MPTTPMTPTDYQREYDRLVEAEAVAFKRRRETAKAQAANPCEYNAQAYLRASNEWQKTTQEFKNFVYPTCNLNPA